MADIERLREEEVGPKEFSLRMQPQAAFAFQVIIDGVSDPGQSFQEAEGIGPDLHVEQVSERGDNRFVYRLPDTAKHSLVLKRGIASAESPLVLWCGSALESGLGSPILTKEISLYLLDENGNSLRGWSFAAALPVRWEVAGLMSTHDEIAIASVEFSYSASKPLD